jgi:hypothetical protein
MTITKATENEGWNQKSVVQRTEGYCKKEKLTTQLIKIYVYIDGMARFLNF